MEACEIMKSWFVILLTRPDATPENCIMCPCTEFAAVQVFRKSKFSGFWWVNKFNWINSEHESQSRKRSLDLCVSFGQTMSTKPVGRGQDASPDIVVIVVDIDAARKLELTNDRLSGRIIRLGTGCEF